MNLPDDWVRTVEPFGDLAWGEEPVLGVMYRSPDGRVEVALDEEELGPFVHVSCMRQVEGKEEAVVLAVRLWEVVR